MADRYDAVVAGGGPVGIRLDGYVAWARHDGDPPADPPPAGWLG